MLRQAFNIWNGDFSAAVFCLGLTAFWAAGGDITLPIISPGLKPLSDSRGYTVTESPKKKPHSSGKPVPSSTSLKETDSLAGRKQSKSSTRY